MASEHAPAPGSESDNLLEGMLKRIGKAMLLFLGAVAGISLIEKPHH